MSYLLRVLLPDRPGSLGALAVALGSVGADILSLDVVERGTGFAVDDLIVDVPRGALPDTLITAAEQLPGTRVDSIRPFTGMLDAHRELELIDHVAGAGGNRLQVLVDEAPRVLQVHWATVVETDDGNTHRIAGSPGAPETPPGAVAGLPLTRAAVLDATADWVPPLWQELDTQLAAAPLGSGNRTLVVARTGGPEFRPAEVARLGYLAGIVATVLR